MLKIRNFHDRVDGPKYAARKRGSVRQNLYLTYFSQLFNWKSVVRPKKLRVLLAKDQIVIMSFLNVKL